MVFDKPQPPLAKVNPNKLLYGKRFIQQSKKYNRHLNLSNYIENLKLTLHKADPSTELIVNLIKTKHQDFKIPNPNEYVMF